jgi:hypothetical protein
MVLKGLKRNTNWIKLLFAALLSHASHNIYIPVFRNYKIMHQYFVHDRHNANTGQDGFIRDLHVQTGAHSWKRVGVEKGEALFCVNSPSAFSDYMFILQIHRM